MSISIGTRMRVACIVVCVWPALSTAQTIRPQFGWTAGSSAEVTTVTEINVTGLPATLPTRAQRLVQALRVQADPRGLIIHEVGRGASLATDVPSGADLEQLMGSMESRFLVSRSGAFQFVLDTNAIVARADSLIRSVKGMVASVGVGAATTSLVPPTASSLDLQFRRQWESLVGHVGSRAWTRGDSTISSVMMDVPLDSGRQMSIGQVLRFDGEVKCPAADSAGSPTDRTCWQFSSALQFPADFMKKAIERARADLEARMPPEMASRIAAAMPVPEQSIRYAMIYEPATLRPLRIVSTIDVVSKSELINTRFTTVSTRSYRWSGTP